MQANLPLLSLLFICNSPLSIKGDDEGCSLLGQSYKIGDVMYPKLESSKSNYCVSCRCELDSTGRSTLNCTSTVCSVACTPRRKEGECCTICSESENLPTPEPQQSDAASSGTFGLPPLASQGGGATHLQMAHSEMSFAQRCLVATSSYAHGETFPGNVTDPKREKCTQCVCNNGKAHCKVKSCPRVSCSNPVTTQNDCCSTCPGDLETDTRWDTVVSFSSGSGPANKDCKSGDRYFTNGASWHPIIGPFGEMDCVLCKCNSGRIDCARLKCHNKRDLPCEKPIKVTGHCCPVCEKPIYEDEIRSDSSAVPVEKESFKSCISTRSDFTIWKSSSGGMSSQVLQYLFVPFGSKNPKLEIHHHRIMLRNKQIDDITAQSVSFDDYNRLKSKFHFTLIGGTTHRLVSKLEKRESKLMRKCSKYSSVFPMSPQPNAHNPCSSSIPNFEGILKVRKIQTKQWCGAGEREI